jgi:hypothetical protein
MSVTQIEKLLDPCARKHGGNEQSREANRKNRHNRSEQRAEVLRLITEAGDAGLSMKEVANLMSTQFSSVSGRGSELKTMEVVEPTGEIRAGSAVLRATGYVGLPKAKHEPLPEPVKAKAIVKPLSPSQAKKELADLEFLYEHSSIETDTYDAAKKAIYDSIDVWSASLCVE